MDMQRRAVSAPGSSSIPSGHPLSSSTSSGQQSHTGSTLNRAQPLVSPTLRRLSNTPPTPARNSPLRNAMAAADLPMAIAGLSGVYTGAPGSLQQQTNPAQTLTSNIPPEESTPLPPPIQPPAFRTRVAAYNTTGYEDRDDPETLRARFSRRRTQRSWHTSSVPWKHPMDSKSFQGGRVLIVNFTHTPDALLKIQVAHEEIYDEQQLKRFYKDSKKSGPVMMRLVHVQCASWATDFLMKKYNINSQMDLVGTDFARWVGFEKPEWRAGKPLLKGRSWRTQRDPWRAVSFAAFGLDYLQAYDVRDPERAQDGRAGQIGTKMMELNGYDVHDAPEYGHDVFVQRISVHVQHATGEDQENPDGENSPYAKPEKQNSTINGQQKGDAHVKVSEKIPSVEKLDNNNTIIVFEHSQTERVRDTLIPPRHETEVRWRRLNYFLRQTNAVDEQSYALATMNFILEDVLKDLSKSWDKFINLAESHVAILEDKIFGSPADETRSPELWDNITAWLKVRKLSSLHKEVVKEMGVHLEDMVENEAYPAEVMPKWLDGIADEFRKCSDLVEEDLLKPTLNVVDLMYKSVAIRDTRQSLQLGTSMWRLSWITFIFLPLTFIVGFFGMNVDIFANNPSIKYYFAAAVPFMLVILICWYALKHWLAARRNTSYQRGVYEHLFQDLAHHRPELWTRTGPRVDIKPLGVWGWFKWKLLSYWFHPSRTIRKPPSDPDVDEGGSGLGAWARLKRTLARRWIGTIKVTPDPEAGTELGLLQSDARRGLSVSSDPDTSAQSDIVEPAISVKIFGSPDAAHPSSHGASMGPQQQDQGSPGFLSHTHALSQSKRSRDRRSSSVGSPWSRPSSSGASSGYMVDDQVVEEDVERQVGGVSRLPVPNPGLIRMSLDGAVMENVK